MQEGIKEWEKARWGNLVQLVDIADIYLLLQLLGGLQCERAVRTVVSLDTCAPDSDMGYGGMSSVLPTQYATLGHHPCKHYTTQPTQVFQLKRGTTMQLSVFLSVSLDIAKHF